MRKIFVLSCALVFLLSSYAYASDLENKKEDEKWSFPYTKEIGVISGYAQGKLEEKGLYKIIPGILRLGFNLDSIGLGFCDILHPAARKLNIKLKGFTEFLLETYANGVVSPDDNVEAGAAIFLKYSYPLTQKIYPYALGGGGVGYISQHTREQAIQWGFTPQIGAGISYFFRKDTSLSLEYRKRHFSNADIK
ncbi:MAG: acyloxyacyl hydrolase, partial [Candidatus Omnitrophica bacterium]|nr:acyloxyacyl hydrolase [Candidatus Omnitrophota bacterium]